MSIFIILSFLPYEDASAHAYILLFLDVYIRSIGYSYIEKVQEKKNTFLLYFVYFL